MSKIFFTSDLHFGHENVLRFDSRPFATVEEMDSELIRRWNAKVGRGDLVYVLGDMIYSVSRSPSFCGDKYARADRGFFHSRRNPRAHP